MKLKSPRSYSTAHSRERFAEYLSAILQVGKDRTFQPYKPNADDDLYWTLDAGNDWKVRFMPDDSGIFEIRYRYSVGNPEQEAALAGWLKARIGVEVVG